MDGMVVCQQAPHPEFDASKYPNILQRRPNVDYAPQQCSICHKGKAYVEEEIGKDGHPYISFVHYDENPTGVETDEKGQAVAFRYRTCGPKKGYYDFEEELRDNPIRAKQVQESDKKHCIDCHLDYTWIDKKGTELWYSGPLCNKCYNKRRRLHPSVKSAKRKQQKQQTLDVEETTTKYDTGRPRKNKTVLEMDYEKNKYKFFKTLEINEKKAEIVRIYEQEITKHIIEIKKITREMKNKIAILKKQEPKRGRGRPPKI